MGLDIALGLLILSSAIRGWMRGFLMQAIQLVGLIGCVFAADPLRDQARPYIAPHLTSLRPELLDRLLWWGSAIAVYVVTTGIAMLAVKMYRKRTFGLEEANRTDQFAGFLVGGIKGMVFALFIVAGLQKFAVERLKGVDWADEQAKTSQAMAWDTQYHFADKIWTSPPVQKYLAQIRDHGLQPIGDPSSLLAKPEAKSETPEPAPVANADRPPRLNLPDPNSTDFKREFDKVFEDLDRLKSR